MNIAAKIGVIIASVLAISLLVQVFYVFPQIRSREFKLQVNENEVAANNIEAEIRSLQDNIRYELEMLARMPEIKSMDIEKQRAILSFSIRSSPAFETISIADSSGMVTAVESRDSAMISLKPRAVGTNISGRDYFKSCISTGKIYYSNPFLESLSNSIRAVIATPIRSDEGANVGVIFADVPLQTMIGIIRNCHLDEAEGVYMVGSNGFVLAHSAQDLTQLPRGPLSLDYSNYTIVQDLSNRRSGVQEYKYNGETYLACYRVVGASGWGIVFQEPMSVVRAKSNIVPNFLFGINAALFVAAILIAVLLSRRIISPIAKLADYAERVKTGDYTAKLEVKGKDEIAGVTSAIKSMVRQMVAMQEAEMTIIVNSMKDGLIVLDQNQRIIRLNPAMEQMLGVAAAEVINKSISELQTNPNCRPLVQLVQTQSSDYEVVLTDPRERALKVHSSRLKGREGEKLGEVKVVIDITRERELDQMKSDFIANTSHELRTPLHSIRGFVKLMLDGKVPNPETQQEFLVIIDEQSQHLNNLVDSILNIAAIESGEMVFDRQPVSMKQVIDKTVVKLQRLGDDKEIAIETSLPETLPNIEGDPEKLGQVMTNLVGNAIKFSPQGSKVLVTARPDNNGVLVQVTDQGIGIPVDAIPRLFQKFSKVDNSITQSVRGTGLGLYIAKQIVEAHGGHIWVESEPNKGSTFSFTVALSPDYKNQQEGGQRG